MSVILFPAECSLRLNKPSGAKAPIDIQIVELRQAKEGHLARSQELENLGKKEKDLSRRQELLAESNSAFSYAAAVAEIIIELKEKKLVCQEGELEEAA